MPLVKVGQASSLEADSVLEVMVGDTPYALCKLGGAITALSGVCPHRGGPLGQGQINGKNVVCPWHAWEWNCVTGENDMDATKKVATFAVRVDDDDILLDLPA